MNLNSKFDALLEWLKDEGAKLLAISLTLFFVTGFCAGYVACEKVAENFKKQVEEEVSPVSKP